MMFYIKVKALALEAYKNMQNETDDKLQHYYSGQVGAYVEAVTIATGETAVDLLQELANNYQEDLAIKEWREDPSRFSSGVTGFRDPA